MPWKPASGTKDSRVPSLVICGTGGRPHEHQVTTTMSQRPLATALHIRASPLILDENLKHSNVDMVVIVGYLLAPLKLTVFHNGFKQRVSHVFHNGQACQSDNQSRLRCLQRIFFQYDN